jgi:N utilization substance protein B
MSLRRKSREITLQILYQNEFENRTDLQSHLDYLQKNFQAEDYDRDFTLKLLNGVLESRPALDQKIQTFSRNWKIDRMSHIDRNILRLSVFEMTHLKDEVPAKASINEAIELAKKYGTEDSSAFVNGLLDQISKSI